MTSLAQIAPAFVDMAHSTAWAGVARHLSARCQHLRAIESVR
jgi:hypothetical protein